MKHMLWMRLLAAAVAAAIGAAAHAQSTYPNKPVRLIISFTPGSAIDIVGRIVATKLAEIWGQPVIPENRAGAGGSIGSALVVQSPPDGYTLLANSSAHASNPAIYAKLPYDTLKDFTNLSPLAGQPNVLIVGPQSGWNTLADFLAAARAKPGELNFSSAGLGSGTHLNLEKLMLMSDTKVTHVPYKGTPEAISDTIAGRVCCYFAPITAAVPHVTGGKATALAVSSARRAPLLPDVPTVAEAGVAGFEYTLWLGLWGPPGMPADVAAKINRDVQAALASSDIKARRQKIGAEPMQMTIPEFTQFVQREVTDSQRIIQAAGIKPQ
jgi:tripartite-type tricarboxylate transporter receptor subunit TctC